MSEIKFACPHCSQHVACNSDYGGLSIECPSCDGTMVVPRLSHVDSAPTGMVIVASTPPPSRRASAMVSTSAIWPDVICTGHEADKPEAELPRSLIMISIFLPIVGAFLLGPWPLNSHLVERWLAVSALCSLVAAWLILRRAIENKILCALATILLAAGIVVMQIGAGLFVGCCRGIIVQDHA